LLRIEASWGLFGFLLAMGYLIFGIYSTRIPPAVDLLQPESVPTPLAATYRAPDPDDGNGN
jgi:hypothetical protein